MTIHRTFSILNNRFIPFVASLFFFLYACGDKQVKKTLETPNDSNGFHAIFDGTTLTNWEGDSTFWRVENGSIIGEITPETLLKTNTFLIYTTELKDFELKTEFRISENGNSGINYRSERLDTIPFALRGYQADIDGKHRYTGQNYEERKRTTLAYRGERVVVTSNSNGSKEPLGSNIKNNAWQSRQISGSLGKMDSLRTRINDDWNECHLIIKGNRLQHYINGVLMSDVTDNDTINRKDSGFLGFQVHVGPPMKVTYRNIRLKKL